jgi:hypothetical protein
MAKRDDEPKGGPILVHDKAATAAKEVAQADDERIVQHLEAKLGDHVHGPLDPSRPSAC